MKYNNGDTPKSVHATELRAARDVLVAGAGKITEQVRAVHGTVVDVAWTGRWADDVRADLDATYTEVRIAAAAMRYTIGPALGRHAAWIDAERTRLWDLEQRVRDELKRRAEMDDCDKTHVFPQSYTWYWDDFARQHGIDPGTNAAEGAGPGVMY